MKKLIAVIPVVVFAVLLAACGSSTSASSNTSAATTSKTTKCPTISVGTIQNISSNSLVVTNLQGKQSHVTFTSATKFIRTSTIAPSSLQTGSLASVTVMENANNTYSALTMSVRNPQAQQGGFTRGSTQCRGQFTRGNRTGTPGTFGAGQNRQVVSGTISQISGNAVTLSNASGDNFIVNLTSTTRITTQLNVSANDLKSGEPVMITGVANGQGVINASSVSILQSLPSGRPPATATPNA
jgi:Domain of unknown function (DUF5666)